MNARGTTIIPGVRVACYRCARSVTTEAEVHADGTVWPDLDCANLWRATDGRLYCANCLSHAPKSASQPDGPECELCGGPCKAKGHPLP